MKNKRGSALRTTLVFLIIAIVVFIIMATLYGILTGKIFSAIDYIKNIF